MSRGAAALLVSSFLSGATLLGLEVVWFRFLTMFVLSTTLAATTMLAVVLASIGLGGLIASAWLTRSPGAWRHLPALAFWAGVGVVSSYAGFQVLTSGTQIAEWNRTVWLAGALTAPASIISGMLFTFTGAALDRVLRDGARTAGWVALSNTAGSMCGPLFATFVLLPRAGVEGSFVAAAGAYAAVGLFAAAGAGILGARLRSAGLAGAAALAASLAFFPHGLMAGTYFPRISAPYTTDGSSIVATREGPSETILLMQRKWLGEPDVHAPGHQRVLDVRHERLRAALHAVFRLLASGCAPRPAAYVLVICYGVGVTAGAARDLPDVETIDVVDTSREVVAMSDELYRPMRTRCAIRASACTSKTAGNFSRPHRAASI